MKLTMVRWTDERKDELSRLYDTMTSAELARRFGTTRGAIRNQVFQLGLHKGQPNKIELTREKEIWLRLNFPSMSNLICAMLMGISVRSVTRLARRLGLEKTGQFMEECQTHAAKKAKESHLKNGTYPPKGWYSPNLQKGARYIFKPGENRHKKAIKETES